MKIKSSTLVVILLVSMTPIFFSAFAVTTPLFGVGDVREELYAPLDANVLTANGLPEVDPFWVDIVDAEVVPNDGEGVYIAVLDTGLLDSWPFFFSEANIRWDLGKGFTHDLTWDTVAGEIVWGPLRSDRGFITKAFEGSGHGTHVTSTIVGFNVNNEFWVRGVAPKASIIPVLVLDYWMVDTPEGWYYDGGGTDEMVSAGIYYVADLAETLDGPVIISMSLGGPEPTKMIEDAVDYAIDKGVIVVASAGNEGYNGMGWPGAYPQVISVAAGGWTEQWLGAGWWLNDVPEDLKTPDYWGNNWQLYLEDFSSRPNKDFGQKSFHLDVCAPGSSIVGPYKSAFAYDLNYYYLWGTSMSAPHVSGIAALVLQSYPSISQGTMEKSLKNAAHGFPLPADGSWVYDPWYELYHFEWSGNEYGAGWLQADAALTSAAKFA